MVKISKTHNISQPRIISGKLTMLLLMLLAICVCCRPAEAETSIYVFSPDQSSVFRSGGIAGLQKTFSVAGQFRLTVDPDAGVASFETVDANLIDETDSEYGQSLNEIFNMTGLVGTIIDDTTIEFGGKTAEGTESDVRLKLSFSKSPAHITGNTTPPPNSADMFFYEIDAVATKKYAGGTGEPNDPYQIATADDLILLGETPEDYDKHFILTDDIDLDPNLPDRKVFDKAVIAPGTNDTKDYFEGVSFTGAFDGNSHVIGNLHIQGGDYLGYLGLFGQLDSGATVSNLGMEAVNVNGTGNYVGGLVGQNDGSIATSYSTGTVTGDTAVGGFVGLNVGKITASYSTSMVIGFVEIGGLVGQNGVNIPTRERNGAVLNCYSMGAVTGDWAVGGLVGANRLGNVDMSYSTGVVADRDPNSSSPPLPPDDPFDPIYKGVGGLVGGNISNLTSCFWDMETSGQRTSDGGVGKTTAEMQTASTFLVADWDFVDETENGTENIWSICEGTNYPRLVWQIPAGDFVCPDGITIDDFSFFMEHWLDDNCDSSNGYCQGTDLDQSGTVDAYDLEIFFENWLGE